MRAAVKEVVLAIQQALCAEYGVDRIQDIPAGVLPKLSEEGETEQVLRFIAARCPLDGLDEYCNTGLITASYEGHVEIVRLLIQQPNIDLNKKDDWNDSPLEGARKKNHTEIVQLLTDAGAQ